MKNWLRKLKQSYGDMKLQSKFTAALMLAVTVPVLLLGIFFYGRLYEMVVSYTIKQEQDASAKTAPILQDMVQQVMDVSDSLSSYEFYTDLFQKPVNMPFSILAVSQAAKDFKDTVNELTDSELITGIRLYVDLPENSSLFSSPYTKGIVCPVSQIQGTYWYGIFQGSNPSGLFCPPFYLGTQEKNDCGSLAYIRTSSLYYHGTAYKAYVSVYYSEENMAKMLQDNLGLEGSVSYIINDRNNLVASSDPSLSGIYWLNYETIEESFMSSNNFIERTILGRKIYAGFYRINQPEWFMVTVLPSEPLTAQSNDLMIQYVILYVVFLILALIFANMLAHSVTGRISSVISQMKKVRQGPPVPMDSPVFHDEVGDLIDTYNYMTRKMNQLMDNQAKAAEDLRIAEFNSLQAQINPHFLYNTMDMINWMAQQGQTSEICNAVQNLSRFYKLTLSRKRGITTLAKEEEHVSIYIDLQNMRYHDRISFISDVPDELMEYQIPKLTLQPVVENAILHGILEKPEKAGTIVLTGWMEDEDIVLLISDDGVGISPEKMPTILSGTGQSASGGTNIAIYNTHRRLQILYGSKYGLTYSSEPGKGTEVEIRIPAQKEYRNPYIPSKPDGSEHSFIPLITVSNPKAMTMNSVSPETLLKYSQKITQNLYTLKNLHQISDKLSPAEDLYVLAHEVTGDFPEHNHDYYEINYLCRGSIINVIDGNEIYMTVGDLVFLNRAAVHSLRYVQPDTLFINFCLKREAFQHVFKEFYENDNLISALIHGEGTAKPNYIFFSLGHSLHAQALITSIIQEYANREFHDSFALDGYFLLLFNYLITEKEFSYFGTDKQTFEICHFIKEHCTELDSQQLAAHFGYTKEQLNLRLKQRTGRSLDSFLKEVRFVQALNLLSNPNLSIYQISRQCSFESVEDFSRFFFKKLHITPEEYRKELL